MGLGECHAELPQQVDEAFKDVTAAQISQLLGRGPNLREESPRIRETYAYKGLFRTYVFHVEFLKIGPAEHAEEVELVGAQ